MKASLLRAMGTLLATISLAHPASAQQSWVEEKVMVRTANVKLANSSPDGKQVFTKMKRRSYRVLEEKEGRLHIEQLGQDGWVDKSDMVLLAVAVEHYSGLIRQDAANDWAWLQRGRAWQEKGDLDRAFADFEEAIRLKPDGSAGYRNRAAVWLHRKEFDRAIKDFTEAIRLNPKDGAAYGGRGITWCEKDDHDKAIKDFAECIRIDPEDPIAYFHRGNVWCSKKGLQQGHRGSQ